MVGHRFNNVTKKTEEPLPKTVLLKILCNVCLWGPEARGAGKKKKGIYMQGNWVLTHGAMVCSHTPQNNNQNQSGCGERGCVELMCLIYAYRYSQRNRGGEYECRHVCTSMSTEKTHKSWHHIATSRTSTEVLVFNSILQQKEPGLPGEMTGPELYPRKDKVARSTLECQEVRKCS